MRLEPCTTAVQTLCHYSSDLKQGCGVGRDGTTLCGLDAIDQDAASDTAVNVVDITWDLPSCRQCDALAAPLFSRHRVSAAAGVLLAALTDDPDCTLSPEAIDAAHALRQAVYQTALDDPDVDMVAPAKAVGVSAERVGGKHPAPAGYVVLGQGDIESSATVTVHASGSSGKSANT